MESTAYRRGIGPREGSRLRTLVIKHAAEAFAIHVIRALERLCPICCLHLLFWPAAAIQAARDILRGLDLPPPLQRQASPARRMWRLWTERIRLHLTKLMILWPDRLGSARWQTRCNVSGLDELKRLCARDPVVLVTLHFGPLALLKYCLRAHGLPVAALVGRSMSVRPPYRFHLDALSDRASGLANSPHLFDVSQVRAAVEFVDRGGLLLIAIDGIRGRKDVVHGDDYSIQLANGPLRIAARGHAFIVPLLAVPRGAFRVHVHVGKPIPSDTTQDMGTAIMGELLPTIRTYPEHCERRLMKALRVHVA